MRSVEGLRQRVGDLASEEVDRAEASARILVIHLSDLQNRLTVLGSIQKYMTKVRPILEQAGTPDTELGLRHALDRPPPLREIGPTSNLIHFPCATNSSKYLPTQLDNEGPIDRQSEASSTRLTAASPSEEISTYSVHQKGRNPERHDIGKVSGIGTPDPITEYANRPEFDQRLLDDLIKNYGEFVSAANPKPSAEPRLETPAPSLPSEKKSPSDISVSRDLQKHFPSKKEEEIDRQLKKIIKDYGEYDIYSRRHSVNFKYALIGVVVVLAVLSSVVYLLASPNAYDSANQTVSSPTGIHSPEYSLPTSERDRPQ